MPVLINYSKESLIQTAEWSEKKGYKIHLLITQDEEENSYSYSAIALNLPGAGSCGDTEAEAIKNAKDAILGVIASYNDAGTAIPWKDTSEEEIPFAAKQKWIFVYV